MALSFQNRQVTLLEDEHPTGYWGKVTASLDWCEANYEVTYYIAEFWNTISNLAFIIPSLLAAYYIFKVGYERRFALAHLSVGLIGIGSTLFHLTLKATMQFADELPMLYGTAMLLYCVVELPKPPSQGPNVIFASLLAIVTTIISVAYVAVGDPTIFFSAYSVYTLATVGLGTKHLYFYGNTASRWLGYSALGSYAFGFSIWVFENNNCGVVKDFRSSLPPLMQPLTQLHAWWHVFAAIGGYLLVLALLHMRLELFFGNARLYYKHHMLPVVSHSKTTLPTKKIGNGFGNGHAVINM